MYEEKEYNPDPLNVKTKWIDGACYRIHDRKTGSSDKEEKKIKPYLEYDEEEYEENIEQCTGEVDPGKDPDIKESDNGRFKTSIPMPQKFYAYIIGKKGSRRKQIENETKTEISIPRSYRDKNIVITGPTVTNVVSAKRRLQLIEMDLRERHAITHFISFPLTAGEVKSNFGEFKKLVLGHENIKGVHETIFQNVDKVHLTIGTLVLLDHEEIENAAKVLQNMNEDIIKPYFATTGPIRLHIKGLQYMNDDPANVDVLYAKAEVIGQETNHQIQKLSDDIVDYFNKNGIMKKDYDIVKLHATLMNTRYRKDTTNKNDNGRYTKRVSFDARLILDKYGDFDFGVQPLETIHLSNRSTVDKNGYYGCDGLISLTGDK